MRPRSRLRPLRPAISRPLPSSATAAEPGVETVDPEPQIRFAELGVSAPVLEALATMGYEFATPIQARAIPFALEGRDVIGQAYTGSGKTAAFGIPIVERLAVDGPGVQALVLCPTRELCVQVHEELTRIGAPRGIRSVAIYGGEAIRRQLDILQSRPQIVVATPGRLLDHCSRHSINLSSVSMAVLDEADRMLDMGFKPDVERILKLCPSSRQTLLFSATVPEWVRSLQARYMHDPETIVVGGRIEVPPTVRQVYLQTTWADKVDTLCRILDQPSVVMSLIFTETKRNADMLEVQLQRRGYGVALMHGDLSQRERDLALQSFRDNRVRHLIATNVAARGLDIDDISHVVNYDVPLSPEEYLHRVGRTGRAGREGVAVTLITPSEILKLREVERMARTRIDPAAPDDFPLAEHAVTA